MRTTTLYILLIMLGLVRVNAQPTISNTQTLKVYRLAIYVTYNAFNSSYFNKNSQKVKQFWQDTEHFLNVMYMRDIGVRFELVKDERLIVTDPDKEIFPRTKNASYVIGLSTKAINDLIGVENYDVGICISYTSSIAKGVRGLAYIKGVYNQEHKADAVAVPTANVIAHEIGHLFGGIHTFSGVVHDYASEKTEYDKGQSVMSHGNERDFFSLSSVERIRKFLNEDAGAHLRKISFTSAPPKIDKTKIKKQYTIPKDTYFQFYVPATDPDSEQLYYMAQQRDVRKGEQASIAQYIIPKRTTTNLVTFKKEYNKQTGNEIVNSWLSNQKTGIFTFWIGVSDAKPDQALDYIVQYDLVETQVLVKEGIPFKITTHTVDKKYQGGKKLSLTWNVDNQIFRGTKVRILLSDDLGETFKYVLAEGVDNNGNYEVTLPNINIGKVPYGNTGFQVPAGVIKIEVMDSIAFALTDNNPKDKGGFVLEKDETLSEMSFVTTPSDVTISCSTAPKVDLPTVTGGCNPSITYKDERIGGSCPNNYIIKRTFMVKDICDLTVLTHVQQIQVEDTVAPTFVGTLPTDISIEKGTPIPAQTTLTATDTCSTVTVTPSKEEEKINGKLSKVIYQWLAKDACGNTATHTQVITITPKVISPLKFVTSTLPLSVTLSCGKPLPKAELPSTEGGCTPVRVSSLDRKLDELCENTYTIERTYTAMDACGSSISYVQSIKIEDTVAPTFVGTLPTDISIEEGTPIPVQTTLTATDTCSTVTVTPSKEEEKINGKLSKVIYQWLAKDACGNTATHTQVITITPKEVIPNPKPIPQKKEIEIYNAVSTMNGSNNYFKVENADANMPVSLLIFNEMGLKVYESDHYQENGEIFRGYANTKGIIAKGQKLPSGTYFYILTYFYKGEKEVKKGFLYVK